MLYKLLILIAFTCFLRARECDIELVVYLAGSYLEGNFAGVARSEPSGAIKVEGKRCFLFLSQYSYLGDDRIHRSRAIRDCDKVRELSTKAHCSISPDINRYH